MKEKPVFPLIMSMGFPMMISMLVNSLYNIVDSFFVAKISEDAMTALSLVYPVQNFISAIACGYACFPPYVYFPGFSVRSGYALFCDRICLFPGDHPGNFL